MSIDWERYKRLMGEEWIYALLEKVAVYQSDDDDDIFPVEGLALLPSSLSETGYIHVGSGYADDSTWSFYPFLFYPIKQNKDSVEISLRELIGEHGADAVTEALLDILEYV